MDDCLKKQEEEYFKATPVLTDAFYRFEAALPTKPSSLFTSSVNNFFATNTTSPDPTSIEFVQRLTDYDKEKASQVLFIKQELLALTSQGYDLSSAIQQLANRIQRSEETVNDLKRKRPIDEAEEQARIVKFARLFEQGVVDKDDKNNIETAQDDGNDDMNDDQDNDQQMNDHEVDLMDVHQDISQLTEEDLAAMEHIFDDEDSLEGEFDQSFDGEEGGLQFLEEYHSSDDSEGLGDGGGDNDDEDDPPGDGQREHF